ncbi:hypothetical protein ENUP19_0078G0013 [Entamoeba nuttalli]|uniref:Protein-lysine N-methyltransferase n=2 Tax=Entamoeba nuttalli TaxID=412467 RepID=K2GWZ3_ENTNP|nr:hypothetical protein ENU1_170240 [Entamoeba nuttalli P19]EKE38312.1 hypothetical protein ENU1_170240 [Entamoeba nuttalli P19]|eukprot:XP_008859350.1 hypothetical protein ENU1_170240 [Entamoeba nuttalli P19]
MSESSSSSGSIDEQGNEKYYGFRFDTIKALNEVFESSVEEPKIDEDGFPLIDEDWELSQFWYDKATGDRVIDYIANYVNSIENCKVACVSTPSIYRAYIRNKEKVPNAEFVLFEYDTRFQVFGINFSFYDYKKPTMLKEEYHHQFDLIIVDPPFLSDECDEKVSHTVEFLGKPKNYQLVFLTGKLAEPYLMKYFPGISLTDVRIEHEHQLQNSFGCFSTKDPLI